MNRDEEPGWKYGVVHPEIMECWSDGLLTPTEVLLLMLIDSLVSRTRGCFASNAFLAQRMHMHPRAIRRLILNLREKQLLTVSMKRNNQREIETAWSRPLQESLRRGAMHGPGVGPVRPASDSPMGNLRDICPEFEDSGLRGDKMLIDDPKFQPKKKRNQATKEDQANAHKLRAAILKRSNYRNRWSAKQWAEEMRMLRETLDNSDRLSQVLEWYARNVGGEFIPVAYSAETFRKKFAQIEAAMRRDPDREVELTSREATMVDQVWNELAHCPWPKGSRKTLRQSISRSVVAFNACRKLLIDECNRLADHPSNTIRGFSRVVKTHLGSSFMRQWYQTVRDRVSNWEKWSGVFCSLEFTGLHHPQARTVGRMWAAEYCGNPDVWDRFLSECKGLNQDEGHEAR